MKVICIAGVKKSDTGNDISSGKEIPAGSVHEIYEGETYTVCLIENHGGEDYYSLEERDIKVGYAASRFAPLSDIDETESETYKNLSHAIQ